LPGFHSNAAPIESRPAASVKSYRCLFLPITNVIRGKAPENRAIIAIRRKYFFPPVNKPGYTPFYGSNGAFPIDAILRLSGRFRTFAAPHQIRTQANDLAA
jgi:hypothetical protein